jgi:hypothetical protein
MIYDATRPKTSRASNNRLSRRTKIFILARKTIGKKNQLRAMQAMHFYKTILLE